MTRTQLYVDDELAAQVRQVATLQGRPVAAIIREALRAYLLRLQQPADNDPFLPIVGAYAGGPNDAAQEHDRYLYGVAEVSGQDQ